MNALAIKGERHAQIPEIVGKNNVKLAAAGSPRLAQPTLEVKPEGKKYVVLVQANSKSETRRLLLDGGLEAELQRPLTDNEREQVLAAINKRKAVQTFGTSMELEFSTDVKHEYRSAAHTLLKCLGMFEPEFVKNPASEAIRKFARDAQGEWADFAVSVRQSISPVAMFARNLGNFNAVEIFFSKGIRKVVGVVNILGRIKRSLLLSDYDGPDRIITVFERLGSNQPKGFEMIIDPASPPVPIVELESQPLTIKSIVHDSLRVISDAVSWDAITTTLFSRLEQTVRRHPILNAEAIGEIRSVSVEVCRAISGMYGVKLNDDEVGLLLENHGFAQISTMVGDPSLSPDLQLAVSRALLQTIDTIRERAPKASTVTRN